jgi:hypothetical protein
LPAALAQFLDLGTLLNLPKTDIAIFLVLPGRCHFLLPADTQRWMRKPGVVRLGRKILSRGCDPRARVVGIFGRDLQHSPFPEFGDFALRNIPSVRKSEVIDVRCMAACCWEARSEHGRCVHNQNRSFKAEVGVICAVQ